MNEINELIQHFGQWFYLLTFVWAALEGETFVIFAGFAAQMGFLNIEYLIISAWLGSTVGDQIFFWMGRCFGSKLSIRFPKIETHLHRLMVWIENHAIIFIMSYRFMYGIRNISSIAIGMSHIHWRFFAIWNVIAALIWSIIFSGVGYFFGDVVATLSGDSLKSNMHEIFFLTLILLGTFFIFQQLIAHLHRKSA